MYIFLQMLLFMDTMEALMRETNMTLTKKFTKNLPPSSLHSFRRILRNVTENGELPEILLADHGDTFSNNFYQSVLDDVKNIGFKYHNITIDSNGTCMCKVCELLLIICIIPLNTFMYNFSYKHRCFDKK